MNLFFFETKSSPPLTGFRRNHSKQNALLNIVEKWKHALDKGKKVGTIHMDLSKMFDTLNHNSLLTKLNAYGCNGIRLQTKWLCVSIPLQSLKFQISRLLRAKSPFTFRQLPSVDSL